tara:strand:+ start:69 stop:389 length:321 start_codon:yes stop_codon:yes gene_type:complete
VVVLLVVVLRVVVLEVLDILLVKLAEMLVLKLVGLEVDQLRTMAIMQLDIAEVMVGTERTILLFPNKQSQLSLPLLVRGLVVMKDQMQLLVITEAEVEVLVQLLMV